MFIDASDPAGNPVVRLLGNPEFDAEELIATELGYRWRVSSALHLDIALFDNHYDGLASLEIGDVFTDPQDNRTIIPIVSRNLTDGHTRGAEALLTVSPVDEWRLSASYSYLDVGLTPAGQDLNRGEYYEGATPRHQFTLSSYLTLPGGFEFDAHFRSHSAIWRVPVIVTGEGIPGYSELDLHLSWRRSDEMRISVVGQNLLHDGHVEFGRPAARGAIERGVYARISWEL